MIYFYRAALLLPVFLGVLVGSIASLARADAPTYVYSHLAGPLEAAGFRDGNGVSARFQYLSDIVVDSQGDIFVSDQAGEVVRRISPTNEVTTLAGNPASLTPKDGAGSAAVFSSISAMTVAKDVFYVADFDGGLRKVTTAGQVSTIAPVPAPHANYFPAWAPAGIVVDQNGDIYISDNDYYIIRKYSNGIYTTFAGQFAVSASVDGANSVAEFKLPTAMTMDSAGNLYVVDAADSIRKISRNGDVSTLAGAVGVDDYVDGNGSSARFHGISSITIDARGNLYVAEYWNATVRKITPAGVVSTVAGVAGQHDYIDGALSTARFEGPSSIWCDASGNLYVTEGATNTVRKISSAGYVSTLAGTPAFAGVASPKDGTGTQARFDIVEGLTSSPSGNVYVADVGSIRQISPTGTVTTIAGQLGVIDNNAERIWTFGPNNYAGIDGVGSAATFSFVLGITSDAAGNIFVTDNRAVRELTPDGKVTTIAGYTDPNATTLQSKDGPALLATFEMPEGIAVSANEDIFVADVEANVIRKISRAGAVTTVAGITDFSGWADGPAGSGMLSRPEGIAIDPAGNLYIADSGNDVIRKMTPDGTLSTIAGRVGQPGFADGVGTAALFSSPRYLAIDGNGNLFVGESGNHALRMIAPDRTVSTISGNVADSRDGVGQNANFGWLGGLAADQAGNLYISDLSNEAVRKGVPSYGVQEISVNSNPQNQVANDGGTALFAVAATSSGPLSYQWQVEANGQVVWTDIADGSDYAGSTTSTLSVFNAASINSGTHYRCIISNGTATNVVSGEGVLYVGSTNGSSRLINISTRAAVGTGANVEIAGFIIGGSAPQQVLIRASGPALQKSGITSGFLADPVLTLHATDAAATVLTTNDNWGDDPTAKAQIASAVLTVGTSAWDDGSKDAAILTTLAPGGYTAIVNGKNAGTGIALVEVFAIDTNSGTGKLINLSTRSAVGKGANVQIAGFIIGGSSPKKVVIRANGPALAKYGVTNPLTDPKVELHSTAAGQPIIATNDNWDSASIQPTFQALGIDTWTAGSKDAAIVTTLDPGGYTAIVSGADGGNGVALVEVFDADSK